MLDFVSHLTATWYLQVIRSLFLAIFLCEVAFTVQEFQTAFDLSLSLFGPRKNFEHTQYILTGSLAPKVDILVTVCGEDLSTVMDTVTAAVVQQESIDNFNSSNRTRGSGYQDVVYSARKKPVGQRHYYKSGNLRSGLDFTASNYGCSEYFAVLDSDMISEPDWLARTVPHLIKDENVALVSPPHNYYNVLQEDDLGQDASDFAQILEPTRGFFDCSQCAGSGHIMRRSALDTIGGWPLANVGEDIICSTMLQEQGWKTQFIPDQLQFGLAPDFFHSYINQRIRWTYGSLLLGNRFPFSLRRLIRANKSAKVQHITSSMGAWGAYSSALLFASVVASPISIWALQAGKVDPTDRYYMRLALACHFIASTISRKLVYGRLGNVNVSNMTTNQLWISPINAFCTLKSTFADPGDTSFKVSGTFVSPTDERYPARRKPLSKRLLNVTMVCYMAYSFVTATILALLFTSVVSRYLIVGKKRVYMHTGAALRLVELVLAAIVPVRYMVFPPSLPDRQALLERDIHGVNRSRKKEWTKRDGGSSVRLLLQVAVIVVFDWL